MFSDVPFLNHRFCYIFPSFLYFTFVIVFTPFPVSSIVLLPLSFFSTSVGVKKMMQNFLKSRNEEESTNHYHLSKREKSEFRSSYFLHSINHFLRLNPLKPLSDFWQPVAEAIGQEDSSAKIEEERQSDILRILLLLFHQQWLR